MPNKHRVDRDERTVAVVDTSYRVAYIAISFALLIDVAIRSYKLGEAAWDLFGLVVGGGLIATCYQVWHKALPGKWVQYTLLVATVAAGVAALTALLVS